MSDKNEWKGTTKDLCKDLKLLEVDYNMRFLSTPSVLSKRLKEEKSVLESQGIIVKVGIIGTNNKRYIELNNTNV